MNRDIAFSYYIDRKTNENIPFKVNALRPIVMAILKNLEHVDERFLKQLVTDKQLYQEADVGVKRQIWLYHQSLFGEELGPLFEHYMAVSCS